MNLPTKYSKAVDEAAVRYSQATSLRAGVQIIPWVGGALDTLLGGKGSKILQGRLDDFLKILNDRLSRIEIAEAIDPDESFFDLMMAAFDGVMRARSQEKRKRFASLIAQQVRSRNGWDDAEAAVRLLSDLTDQHVAVLIETLNAPLCKGSFKGLRVVTFESSPHIGRSRFMNLGALFPQIPERTLRLICSELVSRGLMRDEGFGRMETKSMEYFVATDLAKWLMDWIKE